MFGCQLKYRRSLRLSRLVPEALWRGQAQGVRLGARGRLRRRGRPTLVGGLRPQGTASDTGSKLCSCVRSWLQMLQFRIAGCLGFVYFFKRQMFTRLFSA